MNSNFSPDLCLELSGFFNQLLMGQLSTAEAVAKAAQEISDLAWGKPKMMMVMMMVMVIWS